MGATEPPVAHQSTLAPPRAIMASAKTLFPHDAFSLAPPRIVPQR